MSSYLLRNALYLWLSAFAPTLSQAGLAARGNSPAQQACASLKTQFPDITHYPNSSIYTTDNTDFWSIASALGPACDFAPTSAEDLGSAVKVLREYDSPFAIRGGGHMPIAGFNNINSSGVLLSCSGFTQLRLEPDGESVHVGPGNHWEDVNKYLEPHGKNVVGGRLGIVGVPGFVMGGGASFFSAEHGWASNNLKSYTVVLADGCVVKASPTNAYADLFWALRGGGNSFGLITDIEMTTLDIPIVTVGITAHGVLNDSSKYIDAVVDYSVSPEGQTADGAVSIIPIANTGNVAPFNNTISYNTYRFYAGNNTSPPEFVNFTAPHLPVLQDSFSPKTMFEWNQETAPSFEQTAGLRERFYVLTLRGDCKEALQIAHDTYFDMIFESLSTVQVWFTGLSPFPVSKRFLEASAGPNGHGLPNGDPMGVKPHNYIIVEFSLTYGDDEAYEAVVTDFYETMNSAVMKKLEQKGLMGSVSPWLYINDADEGQDVWGGYPKENVKVLQRIRHKYDPDMVFTKSMPGGWKVVDAVI